MKSLISRLIKNESGATAIEYGMIAAGMAVIVIAVFASNGPVYTMLSGMFDAVSTTVNNAATQAGSPTTTP
jgi:pilus assembly protein Flp/PilA